MIAMIDFDPERMGTKGAPERAGWFAAMAMLTAETAHDLEQAAHSDPENSELLLRCARSNRETSEAFAAEARRE